jgi:hypothetical protein
MLYPPANVSYREPERVLMPDRNGLPRLLAGDGCRLTWPVDQQGHYELPRGEPVAYAPLSEPVSVRPLPWAPGGYYRDLPVIAKFIPWTLLWLVVPVLLIRRAMKRNSWRLAFVPAFYQLGMTAALNAIPFSWFPFSGMNWPEWDPHVGICFLTAAFLVVHVVWMIRHRLWALVDASAIYAIAIAIGWSQRLESHNADRYYSAFHVPIPASLFYLLVVISGGFPLIALAIFVFSWLRRRQWIRLSLFLLVAIVLAAGYAALLMEKDGYWRATDEEYSLDGWYLVFFDGLNLAACLLMFGWTLKHVASWCRRRASRLLARFARKKVA